jgi:hypothetical protein
MQDIETTLSERGTRYGRFETQAAITQDLKGVIRHYAREVGQSFHVDQIEALDMICSKIARIVNGDPNYADSWHDIAGYAKLVENRLNGDSDE